MPTTTKKPTVAETMARVDELHRQIVRNQESIDAKMSDFDKEVRSTLEQWNKRNARDKENLSTEFDDLKKGVTKKHSELADRIEEIGGIVASVKQAAETSRETTLDIKRTVDTLQSSLTKPIESPPAPLPGPAVATIGWDSIRKNPWYPWAKFVACCVLGVSAYHYLLVPALTRTIAPNTLPNIFRPTVDVHTPYGAATVEVSREPFRSDSASRAAFGRIFARLDDLVRTGQLNDFEGYYNEFGREMQGAVPGPKYGAWAELWSRLAVVCHRSGNGAADLRAFNANLQSAARAVSGGAAEMPDRYELSGWNDRSGADAFAAGYGSGGTQPAPAGATEPGPGQRQSQADGRPFLQNRP